VAKSKQQERQIDRSASLRFASPEYSRVLHQFSQWCIKSFNQLLHAPLESAFLVSAMVGVFAVAFFFACHGVLLSENAGIVNSFPRPDDSGKKNPKRILR
jgi:hypothetical protein